MQIRQCTDQAPAPAAQAGILQPGPHVLVGADDQRSDHQDPLPVLDDALTTLWGETHGDHRGQTVRRVTLLLLPSKRSKASR